MDSREKQKIAYSITLLCLVFFVFAAHLWVKTSRIGNKEQIKVGFVYVGDSCNAYTNNFLRAQNEVELEYGNQVECISKYNVQEGSEERYILELVEEGCELIFTTSYGYGDTAKRIAADYPQVQFCLATNANANEEPRLDNVHNYMGEIYQGRYVSGVVAGMKLQELIEKGSVSAEEAKVGYVAAFPYAEVISGYTAFLLGVRSVVDTAKMTVIYTNSWGEYDVEKKVAERLISEGCVIISQHSDTAGPAVACENAKKDREVYHVGYNQSMTDVAPTSSLISSRINWNTYMVEATGAVLKGKKIESVVEGNVHGNDVSGGFKENWVQMLTLNETIAAPGTKELIAALEEAFKKGEIQVFYGDYIGIDPFDSTDVYNLREGYVENAESSAPQFHYVLADVITVEE